MSLASDIMSVKYKIECELQGLIQSAIKQKLEEFNQKTGAVATSIDVPIIDATHLGATWQKVEVGRLDISFHLPEMVVRHEE